MEFLEVIARLAVQIWAFETEEIVEEEKVGEDRGKERKGEHQVGAAPDAETRTQGAGSEEVES